MSVLVATAVLATLTTGFEISEQQQAEQEKERIAKQAEQAELTALQSRESEEKISASQKTVARDNQVENLVGHQMAVEAASGFELGSASFKAITADDFDKFAQNRSNDALELSINENQLQQDMLQTQIQTSAQISGDKSEFASGVFTDIGNLVSVVGGAASGSGGFEKLIIPAASDALKGASDKASQKRKVNPGLFDRTD